MNVFFERRATSDNDMRQLIVMIEEGMATSRALGRRGAGGEGGADDLVRRRQVVTIPKTSARVEISIARSSKCLGPIDAAGRPCIEPEG